MQRSLIQLSPSTAVISLPAPWIERNRLKKGAKLELEEHENRIIVSALGKRSEREVTIDVSALPKRLLWMRVDAAYGAGYDTITVKTKDREQAAYMTTVARYFPGLIIEEERSTAVRLRDIAQESNADFGKLLARIFNSIIALAEDAAAAVRARDWQMLLDAKRRDYTLNTYVSLCQRHLSRFGYERFSQTGVMHTYVKMLEMLADKLCALLEGWGRQRPDGAPGKQAMQTLDGILRLCRLAYKLRFSYTQELLVQLEDERGRLLGQLGGTRDTDLEASARAHRSRDASQKLVRDPHLVEILELFFEIEELESALHV